MSTVLCAAGLTERYGRVAALDGLDLEVDAGEVHAFPGPNGAGKTTTIRILLGYGTTNQQRLTRRGRRHGHGGMGSHRRGAREYWWRGSAGRPLQRAPGALGRPEATMSKGRWPVASCDADFAPYLAGRPEASVAMFGRFIDLARAAGPVIFELQNGPVVLRGTRRIFASVRVADTGLAGHINLTRPVGDRRIRKAEALTKTVVFHPYLATSMSDLDATFGRWLAEARAVGDGTHLTRRLLSQAASVGYQGLARHVVGRG
jgi:energy-coupling factor transporter ATP-binding protein EcfA2